MVCYFILESIDGGGKSTQVKNIEEYLKNEGYKVKAWNEPYLPEVHRLLDYLKLLKERDPKYFYEIKDDTFAMIFTIDRNLKRKDLEQWLIDEYHVVADRSWLTTMNYQIDSGFEFLDRLAQNVVEPDCVIYLDIDVDTAIERLQKRDGDKRDHFESRDNLIKASENYKKILKRYDFPVYVIDANRSVQEVFEDCLKVVNKYITPDKPVVYREPGFYDELIKEL